MKIAVESEDIVLSSAPLTVSNRLSSSCRFSVTVSVIYIHKDLEPTVSVRILMSVCIGTNIYKWTVFERRRLSSILKCSFYIHTIY